MEYWRLPESHLESHRPQPQTRPCFLSNINLPSQQNQRDTEFSQGKKFLDFASNDGLASMKYHQRGKKKRERERERGKKSNLCKILLLSEQLQMMTEPVFSTQN
jgi:hypothetical protein